MSLLVTLGHACRFSVGRQLGDFVDVYDACSVCVVGLSLNPSFL
jgi:hypothetical protein